MSLLSRMNAVVRPRGHVFYGWWIVAASGGIQMLAGMLWMQATGAYMVLLQSEFGWSSTVVSIAFALTRIESGLLGPLQGWMADRFGPRTILTVGTLMFGAGFIGFSMVDSILTFFIAFAAIALGSSLGGFPTLMVSIVSWFDRNRSKAVAISQMGFAFGGLAVPVVVLCLEAFGWRTTAALSGVIIIAVGLPLAQVIRHRPGPYGEVPDGRERTDIERAAAPHVAAGTRDFRASEALRTPAFWLISGGHALALLTVSAVMLHLVPHLTRGLGYSLGGAALVVSLLTGFQVLGQLIGGFMGDRFNKRMICALCMVGHCVGLLLVTYATSWVMVLGFAALHGLAWGARGPLMVALRADYFGAAAFGTIMGWSSLIVMFGMSGGPIIAGVMADISGDYRSGLTLLALLSLTGSVLFALASPPPRPAV